MSNNQHTSMGITGLKLTLAASKNCSNTTHKLSVRKFYNNSLLSVKNQRPCHEIANHYRDYKLLPARLRRRRRCTLLQYYRKPETVMGYPKVLPYDYREELPMSSHTFPRWCII